MFDAALSPQERIVINALSEGVSMTDAAAQAGVHRNTIANWRRNSLLFREALADAQYDRALLFRDKAEARVDRALETLDAVLNDPKASASVRLKAALFIIEKATTPPPPRKYVPFNIDELSASRPTVHPVHIDAQSPAPDSAPAPTETTAENEPSVHNGAQNAQTPFRRATPKVGRNEPCPCGSGQKFKRCCISKPQAQAA
jgi:transposase-like protein